MKILLTNDDGIEADGIRALYEALCKTHTCIAVAPDGERSACSHSISIHNDLSYKCTSLGFAVSGTPADCVKLGVLHLLEEKPDFVISGINNGPNLGSDIIYSGTVSAAFEAAYLGVRGIAISLAKHNADGEYYRKAAAFLAERLEKIAALPHKVGTVYNINYPVKVPYIGYRFTQAGINLYDDRFVPTEGEGRVRLRGKAVAHDRNPEDCDVELIKQGYATITPITLDRNDYETLATLKGLKDF